MPLNVYEQDSVKYRSNAFPSQGTYRLKDPTGAPCVEFELPSRREEYKKLFEALQLAVGTSQSGVLLVGAYGAGKTAALGALHELGLSVAGVTLDDRFLSVFYDCPMASAVPELAIFHMVVGLVDEIMEGSAERLRTLGWSHEDIEQKLAEPRRTIREIQQKDYAPEWYLVLQEDHLGSELLGELIDRHDAFTKVEFGQTRQQARAEELRQSVVLTAERIVQHLETLKRQGRLQDALPLTDEVVQNARPQANERPNPARSFLVFNYIVRWALGDPDLKVDYLHLYLDEVEKVINRVAPENREAIARFFQDILDLREALPDGKHFFIALAMTPAAEDDLIRAAPALRGRRLLPTVNLDQLTLNDLILVVKRHLSAALKDGWNLADTEPFTNDVINTAFRYGNAVLGNALRLLHVGMQKWYQAGHDDDTPGVMGPDEFFEALKGVGIVVPALDRTLRSGYRSNERRLLEYMIARPTFSQNITANSDDESLDEERHAFHLRDLAEKFQMSIEEVVTLLERARRDTRLPGLFVRGGSEQQFVWVSMKGLHEGFLHILQRSEPQVVGLESQRHLGQSGHTQGLIQGQDQAKADSQGQSPVAPPGIVRSISQELRDAAHRDRLHAASANYERGLLRLMRYRWHASNALRSLSVQDQSAWVSVVSRIRGAGVPHAHTMLASDGPVGDAVMCKLVPHERAGNRETASELIHPKAVVLLFPLRVVTGERQTLDLRYLEFVAGSIQALSDLHEPDIPTVAMTLLPEGHYEIDQGLKQRLQAPVDGAPPWVRQRHQMPFLVLRVDEMINFEGVDRHFKVWSAYVGGLDWDIDSLGEERHRAEFLEDTRTLWAYPGLREVDSIIAGSSEMMAARVPFVPVRNGLLREGQNIAEEQMRRAKLSDLELGICLKALTEDGQATLNDLQMRVRNLSRQPKDLSYYRSGVEVAVGYLKWAGLVRVSESGAVVLDRVGMQQFVDTLPVEFEDGTWGELVTGVEIPPRCKAEPLLQQLLALLVSHNFLTLQEGRYRHTTKNFTELQIEMLDRVDTLKATLNACELLGVAPGAHEQGWDRLAELAGPLPERDITELREVVDAIQRTIAQLSHKLGQWEAPLAALVGLTNLDAIDKPAQAFTILAGLAPFRHLSAAVRSIQSQPTIEERLGLTTAAGYHVLKAVTAGVQYVQLPEVLRARAMSDLTPINLVRAQPPGCAPVAAAGLPWGQNEVETFVHQLRESQTRFAQRGIGTLDEVADRMWQVGITRLAELLAAATQAVGTMSDTKENKVRLEQAAPAVGTLLKSLEQAGVWPTYAFAVNSWVVKLANDSDLKDFKQLAATIGSRNITPRPGEFPLNHNDETAARGAAVQAGAALKQLWSELGDALDGTRWPVAGLADLYARAVEYAALRTWARDGWIVMTLADDQWKVLRGYPESGTTAAARELLQQVRARLERPVFSQGTGPEAQARVFQIQVETVLGARAALEYGLVPEVELLTRQCTQLIERCEDRIAAIQALRVPTAPLMTQLNNLQSYSTSQSPLLAIPQLRSVASQMEAFLAGPLWAALLEAIQEAVPEGGALLERVTRPGFDPNSLNSEDLRLFDRLRDLGLVKPVTVWKVV